MLIPNRHNITKPRRPDTLNHSSCHKSEPAIRAVSIFINIENKFTYRSFPSLFLIKNDIHDGKCGQGVLQRVIDDIEGLSLYMTSTLLPLDMGVIKNLKCYYRSELDKKICATPTLMRTRWELGILFLCLMKACICSISA